MSHVHGIYLSKGNAKVRFPILSLGSGVDCPSRYWCRFSSDNRHASGSAWCYAQRTERLRPSVLKSRRRNAYIIAGLTDATIPTVAGAIAARFWRMLRHHRKDARIVRINEAGDLDRRNVGFCCAVIKACAALGIRTYLYSKAPPIYRKLAEDAGATVLHSDHDFVAVPDVASGLATGLNRCSGTCGPCKACPSGVKSWILEH